MKKIVTIAIGILLLAGSMYVVSNFNNSNAKINTTDSNTSNNPIETSNSNPKQAQNSSSPFKQNVVSTPAIDFKLKDLDGNEVSLKDLKGKKIFLNFWATWCPPCRGEMPDIQKVYEETKDSNIVVIAVNLGEDKDTVKAFMEKNHYKFTVLLDTAQNVATKYQISAIPTSFFIDENGSIIYKNVGAMSYDQMGANIKALEKK